MESTSKATLFDQTVSELKNLPDNYLEEVYDFIKYLKNRSGRQINWKVGFKEALHKMNEISIKQGISEKDIEKEIEMARILKLKQAEGIRIVTTKKFLKILK
jgi:ribosomal protein S8